MTLNLMAGTEDIDSLSHELIGLFMNRIVIKIFAEQFALRCQLEQIFSLHA